MTDAVNPLKDKLMDWIATQIRATFKSPKTTAIGVGFGLAVYFYAGHLTPDQLHAVEALALALIGATAKDSTSSGKA